MAQRLIKSDFTGGRLPAWSCNLGGDALFCKAFHHALDRALCGRNESRTPAGLRVREQLRHHRVNFFDISAWCWSGFKIQWQRVCFISDKHSGRREGPRGHSCFFAGLLQRLIRPIARSLSV